MLPTLKLAALPTGGGWGLGEQFARLPAAEHQMAANTAVYKVAPTTGKERDRASEDSSDESEGGEKRSQSVSSGGGFGPGRDTDSVTEDTIHLPPPTKTTNDDDDCTFVDNGSIESPAPPSAAMKGVPPLSSPTVQSDDNMFTFDGTRWRAGFMVSSMDVPTQLPIRAMEVVDGKYLWAAVADEPVCMYDLAGCDLNPQRSVDTVCDATALAAVRVSTAPSRAPGGSPLGRGVGGGGGRGGSSKASGATAFRGGRGVANGSTPPPPRGGAPDIKKPPKVDQGANESLTLWCGVTVPGDDKDHPKGCIALFDIYFFKDDGMINNAHAAPITYIAALPKGTSTGSRVWTSAADGPGGGGTLKVWDGATRKTITRKSLAGPVIDMCAMPPAVCPHVWTATQGEAAVRVWDYEGRERSSARFPPNSNALKFKSDVRTLRYHPHSQLVWVCLNGSTVLVNPKTYDVVQSLPINAVSVEFSTTNPHTVIVVGKLLEGNQQDELRVLIIDVPISSGRTGSDATFVFSADAVVLGQKLPGFVSQSSGLLDRNTTHIQLFANTPLMVLATSSASCHQMAVLTTDECDPIENWGSGAAAVDGAQRRTALQREQLERYKQASLVKKRAAAQQGPKGLVLGMASTSSSSQQASTVLGGVVGKAGATFTRHGEEPDYESTENTMVVHSTVGADGPFPFSVSSKPQRTAMSSPAPSSPSRYSKDDLGSPSVAALLENIKLLISGSRSSNAIDPALTGASLAELTASRTLQDVVEATRDLRRLRTNDSQQQDMLQLYQFAQTQRFAMSSTMGGVGLDAACRAARESRIPSLQSQEGRAVGETMALMAVELEMWRRQSKRKHGPTTTKDNSTSFSASQFGGGLLGETALDSTGDARTASILRLNSDLRAKVAACEAGLTKLQASLEGATIALLGPGQVDNTNLARMRLERDGAAITSTAATYTARFAAACSAVSCLAWEASRSGVMDPVRVSSCDGSPSHTAPRIDSSTDGASTVTLELTSTVRTFGDVVPTKERDVLWLLKSVLHPTLTTVQHSVQSLSRGRSVLRESLQLCVQEGIVPAVEKWMSGTIELATPLAGMGGAFLSCEWDDVRLITSREAPPSFTHDLVEASTHVLLLGTDITSQPLFADVTYAAHMMRLCEQETLVVALDRALAVCEAAGGDCADSGGLLAADLGSIMGELGTISDELGPVGQAFRSDLRQREEVLQPLVSCFSAIHSKSPSPRLSSSTARLTASLRGVPTSAGALIGGYVGLLCEGEVGGGKQLHIGLQQCRLQGHLVWCHVYLRFVGEGLLFISRFLRAHQVAQWEQQHSPIKWTDTVIPLSNEHLVFIADQLQGWRRCVTELDGQLLRPLQAAFKSSSGPPATNPNRHNKIYSLYFHGGADSASNLDSTSEDVEHLLIKRSEVVRLLDVFLTSIQGLGSNATSHGISTVLLNKKEGGTWELCHLPLVERFAASVLDALPFIHHT